MLSYVSPRRPSLPSSAAPAKPTRHPRRATALLTIVKDGDNSIFSVGHRLASEFHQIFSAHPRTLAEHVPVSIWPPSEKHKSTNSIDSQRRGSSSLASDSDFDHSISSPSSSDLSHKKSLSLSTPSSSACTSPSTRHPLLGAYPPVYCYSSTESLGEYIFSSPIDHEEVAQVERVPDPFLVRSLETHEDEADRLRLREASARAAFRLSDRSKPSSRLAAPTINGDGTQNRPSRRRLSSVTRATSLPSFARPNGPYTAPTATTPKTVQLDTPPSTPKAGPTKRENSKRLPLNDIVNMEEEMYSDLQYRRRVSQSRPDRKPLRLSQSLAPVAKPLSRRIAEIPVTPPPIPRLHIQPAPALAPSPSTHRRASASCPTPERSATPRLSTPSLSPPRYRQR